MTGTSSLGNEREVCRLGNWILLSHKKQAAGRCCTFCSGYVFTARPPFPRGANSSVRIDLVGVEGQNTDVNGS